MIDNSKQPDLSSTQNNDSSTLEHLLLVAYFDKVTRIFTMTDLPLREGKERVVFYGKRLGSEKDIKKKSSFDEIVKKSGKKIKARLVETFHYHDDEGGYMVHLFLSEEKDSDVVSPPTEKRVRLSIFQIDKSNSPTLLTKKCAQKVVDFLKNTKQKEAKTAQVEAS